MGVNLNKITLEKQGSHAKLSLEKGSGKISNVWVRLSWTKAVDLDLHAFYITKSGQVGHVYFANKAAHSISLDHDAGVGNTAGNNQENLVVHDLSQIEYVLFATNIFRFLSFLHRNDSFSNYDGRINIRTDLSEIEVPLNAKEKGKWAAIALIDNSGVEPRVINVNKITDKEPDITTYKNSVV